MELTGKHIYLRKMTVEDTDQVIAWRNAPHVMQQFLFRTPLTREMHLRWIKEKIECGSVEQFIICEKESHRGIGSFYFRDIDHEQHTAELGIFIGEKDAIGKGYGTETVRIGVAYGFETLKLNRILLRVLAENTGAIRSYEKNGFHLKEDRKETVNLEGMERTVLFMERERPN